MTQKHLAVVPVPPDFCPVILKQAKAGNISFSDALLRLAIAGAECGRRHKEKQ